MPYVDYGTEVDPWWEGACGPISIIDLIATINPDNPFTGISIGAKTGGGVSSGSTVLVAQGGELIGKIGPKIAPYNPELANRLIQEY